jgi:hypothetical protein
MGVHGDDIVLEIRRVLVDHNVAPTVSEVRIYPRPLNEHETAESNWSRRDGRLEFDCIGRDWFRAFRVTVEALPVDAFQGEFGSDEWLVVDPPPSPPRWRRLLGLANA